MGFSNWTETSYRAYAASTGYQTQTVNEVFASRQINDNLDPSKISLRESVDSEQNPNSTPIILALDVTGSMGKYAHEIAVKHLPELMSGIIEHKPISDPHIMFMGIDDVHWNSDAPLQASQFEADIKIVEQLRDIYLVGRGGSNRSESYDLAWYFAAHKTKIDSYDKRKTPGFLFTFGDEEAPYQPLTEDHQTRVFGPGQYSTLNPEEILKSAQERYQVFHVVIEQGNYCQSRLFDVRESWTRLLGNNVLFLRNTDYLVDVVLGTLAIASGIPIEDVISNSNARSELEYALYNSLTKQ